MSRFASGVVHLAAGVPSGFRGPSRVVLAPA